METMILNNGVPMPVLGFGTFLNRGADCEQSVCKAIQMGYRLIDTAEAYGNEEQVGSGIKKSGVDRKALFITTKVNFKSYEHAREAVLASLKALGTDYLDLVLLHWPFGNYYKAWRELETLYAEGTVRAIGVSNFNPDRLIDLIAYHTVKPALNQMETNLYCQRQWEHIWEKKYGVAHQGYAPLGQGRVNEMFQEDLVRKIAGKYRKTPAQVLLRFLIQNEVSVIPKSVHAGRIEENRRIFDFALTCEEMAALRRLDKKIPLIGNPEKPELVESAVHW